MVWVLLLVERSRSIAPGQYFQVLIYWYLTYDDHRRWIFRMLLPLTALSATCVHLFMPLKPVKGDWKL